MPVSENRLTLVGVAPGNPGHPRVFVQCVCGSPIKSVDKNHFERGRIGSCGCLRREKSGKAIAALHDGASRRLHGHSAGTGTPEYHSWCSMKARCLNQNHPRYGEWGGRGVTVWEPWVNSFEQFLADIGPRPGPSYSVDRFPNPAGNYEPGNVRWATALQQRHNRRGDARQ